MADELLRLGGDLVQAQLAVVCHATEGLLGMADDVLRVVDEVFVHLIAYRVVLLKRPHGCLDERLGVAFPLPFPLLLEDEEIGVDGGVREDSGREPDRADEVHLLLHQFPVLLVLGRVQEACRG